MTFCNEKPSPLNVRIRTRTNPPSAFMLTCKSMLMILPSGEHPGFCMYRQTLTITRRKPPKISLRLHAPIELENLLPFDIQYRIYDKNTDQQWKSYLRHGGIMPVHSVELAHLVLLNIAIQDTGVLNRFPSEKTHNLPRISLPTQRFCYYQYRWPFRFRG